MEKENEKNKAGSLPRHNTLIMIVGIFAVSLFIGMAVQPAIAGEISTTDINMAQSTPDPQCDSCSEAVLFAVEYMIQHVRENLSGIYFLWTVDATLLIVEGLLIGFSKSGFSITINKVELQANVYYWVNKLVGPQLFTTTKLLANIGAIGIGITSYLLTLCKNPDTTVASVSIIEQTTGRIDGFCPVCIIKRIIWKLLLA